MKDAKKHPWGMKNAGPKMPKAGAKKAAGKKPAMKWSKSAKK